MANVVPWPGSPTDPGHVGLWFSMPNPTFDPTKKVTNDNKKQFISGWPFRDPDQFVQRAAWVNTVPDKFKDVWFCTSLQSTTGKTKAGKPKAQKHANAALRSKAIWIDIDVGPNDPKKYPDHPTAWGEFTTLRKTLGLPPPSAVINTGGGLHVYWISDKDLLPHEWLPYAQGLKTLLLANNFLFDPTCTADAARLMRVPGTFNYKYDPPKPVELLPLPLRIYDFSRLDFLKQHAGQAPAKTAEAHQLFAEGANMDSFKAGPLFKITGEPGLEAGIDKFGDSLLDPLPIFQQCGFYKEALLNGGKNNGQPQWNLAVLGTTFMEDGNDIAHRISAAHAAYTADDTQALYDRKMAERTDRGIGYPSCAAIAGTGCKACATCPLFPKGKSPLNIRPAPPVTATVTGTVIPDDYYMPDGFELNDKGIICKRIEQRDDDDNVETFQVPLFQSVLSDFWLEKDGANSEALNFTTTVDKGHTVQAVVPLGEISGMGFLQMLGKKRVLINPNAHINYFREFYMNVIGRLRALAAAHTAVPFGWYEEQGVRRGFVFGGKVMLDDGTERPCGTTDPNIARQYAPSGTMDAWMDAAKVITDRKRPGLNAIILTSFVSPLLELVGRSTVVYSTVSYGNDSGAGKTSAYAVGLSVWGHPVLTKGTKSQTANNVTTVMKTIRNLPFYWDELTNEDEQEKVAYVLHEVDGQKEKGRNKSGNETQLPGTFALAIHYAANISLTSFLRRRNGNHDASLNRVMEWEEKKRPFGPGELNDADATVRLQETVRNYGHMGLKYAKFLALNHQRIKDECVAKMNEVQAIMKADNANSGNSERYWIAATGLLIQAAKYAQQLGLDIDPAEIETFIYKVYAENLSNRDINSSGNTVEHAEDVLTRYLKERDAQDHGLWTNYMQNLPGKPAKPVIILKNPTMIRNYQGGIEFRFAVDNRQLIIAKKNFDEWLLAKKHAENQIYAGIKVVYNSEVHRLAICSGLIHNPGREKCLVLNVTPNTPLWDYMTTFTPPADKLKMEADEPVPDVATGIADAA